MRQLKVTNEGLRKISSETARSFRFLTGQALDVIFPPQSLLTGRPTSGQAMEVELWDAVTFIDHPCCEACGFPFDIDMGEEIICGRCVVKRPAFNRLRSAIRYDDVSRKLVLDLKNSGRTAGLPVFAAHMKRAGRELLPEADLIIPVPLHRSRLLQRRFNQSSLLCRALDKIIEGPALFDPDVLKRIKSTERQGTKNITARRKNVSGAFAVRHSAKARIKGAKIVLVDDVYTTGSTLESCARTLRRAGAKSVDALTLARVVKPQLAPK